MFAVQNH